MTKVGEHITLDIIGTTKEYDPSVFEKVINDIAKAAKVTILNISKCCIFCTFNIMTSSHRYHIVKRRYSSLVSRNCCSTC